MTPRRPPRLRACALVALLLVLAAPGCAWTNRDNRPVWNAFEQNLVPDDETLQWVTAPVTIPLGIVAIVVDLFVAHPIQVMDDAWGASTDGWHDIDWQAHYYSQTAFTLVRIPLTAVHLVLSFVGRSLFDIRPFTRGDAARTDELPDAPSPHPFPPQTPEPPGVSPADVTHSASDTLAWLVALRTDAAAEALAVDDAALRAAWTDELSAAASDVLAQDDAVARLRVRRLLLRVAPPPYDVDPVAAFSDADPRVRLALAEDLARSPQRWSARFTPLRDALLADDDPVVRRVARELLGREGNP
ncbi:MAG: hypothetical protein H6825_03035 [Planctomycetes bacterium]|nr:hypothetical protein [Planctomycetota bacterium]